MQPYSYAEINTFRDDVLGTAEGLRRAHPDAFRNAHNRQEPSGSEFANLLVLALRLKGYRVALNGKRGNAGDLSQDVINFPVSSGGVPDTTRTVPGLVIIDFIASAGTAAQSIAWIDQTGPTLSQAPGLGAWVEPRGAIVSVPPPGTTPPPVQGSTDFGVLRAQLDNIIGKLDVVVHREAGESSAAEAVRDLADWIFNDRPERPSLLAHIDDAKRIAAGAPRDERFL